MVACDEDLILDPCLRHNPPLCKDTGILKAVAGMGGRKGDGGPEIACGIPDVTERGRGRAEVKRCRRREAVGGKHHQHVHDVPVGPLGIEKCGFLCERVSRFPRGGESDLCGDEEPANEKGCRRVENTPGRGIGHFSPFAETS